MKNTFLALLILLAFTLTANAEPRVFTPEEIQQIAAVKTKMEKSGQEVVVIPAPQGPYCLYTSLPGYWLRQKLICGFHTKADCDREADKQNARTHDKGYCQ